MKRIVLILAAAFACLAARAQDIQGYGVVRLSVCNMRSTPDFDAEMVSQALLGTPVHILEVNADNGWPRIMTPEGYTGWVHRAGIAMLPKDDYSEWNAAEKAVVTSLTGLVMEKPGVNGATISDIVGGDRLKYLGSKGSWIKVGFPDGRTGWVRGKDAQRERTWLRKVDRSPEAILRTALSMNGFPYLWAGMSPKGMDCSGFVRATLAMHGIIIPRDASQQAPKGERIIIAPDFSNLEPGDLLFFGRKGRDGAPDRVSHVAFYLGKKRFIHSLGLVTVASMDPDDPDYDAYNTGRLLFASRILPFIDRQEGLNTVETNPYYNE